MFSDGLFSFQNLPLLVFLDDFLQHRHRAVTALHSAVGEDQRRGAGEAQLFAQRGGFGDGVVAAGFAVFGELAFAHPFRPDLGMVFLAPDKLGFARGVGVQARNRHHEVVNRDVGHFFKFVLQTFAERAVGVGEHGDFQFAVAAHFFNRFVQRQGGKVDFVQFGDAFFSDALAFVDVDEVAHQHVVARSVGIDDLFAGYDDFVNAFERRFADTDDFQVLAGVGFFQLRFHCFDHVAAGRFGRSRRTDGGSRSGFAAAVGLPAGNQGQQGKGDKKFDEFVFHM